MNETELTLLMAAKLLWAHKFSWKGRATRTEFWLSEIILGFIGGLMYLYASLVMFMGFQFYDETLFLGVTSLLLITICGIITIGLIILTITSCIRRLHDIGKSGWYVWVGLIPIVGQVLLIIWISRPSDGDNRYGSIPVY